ncbi:DNA/RNA non-specific endonuclease [Aquimarina mytili]|uniref:Endonuclease n=1 Tax=Aquimarina mytili TaxID=874423 RepID=A0A936ZWX5_9FLAO|nr:DNA/RNA non-specific endonuclease [Aquimarina mytili]MBL0683766.1 DNA/RNA non-specific endonuclease [Aquimarina mytili]
MTRKYLYPLLIIIVTIGFYYFEEYAEQGNAQEYKEDNKSELSFFYLPTSTTGTIITHNHYSLSYSEKHEQAEWVAYHLKKEHLSSNEFKRPYFEVDKRVRTSSADWRNYKKSGYDRGHLCPAGDRRFSYDAFEETFLTSNVTPQNHQFNSGIWNDLEQKVRYWAKTYNGVYVVTGGVLSDNLKTIGYEAVSVPKYFYKIILNKNADTPRMIAFLMEAKDSKASLKEFVVSVDHIEELTGIDFFPKLEDDVEVKLEASTSRKGWKF